VQTKWRSASLPDDPAKVANAHGTAVFATAGPNTHTGEILINTRDQGNAILARQGFSPIGQAIEALIQTKRNAYLEELYPKVSYIAKAVSTQ